MHTALQRRAFSHNSATAFARALPAASAFSRNSATACALALPAASTFTPASVRHHSTAAAAEPPSTLARFKVLTEVCVSKIGPAGAGWWAANAYADSIGYGATDMGYFAITGLGDASAVLLGHSVYFMLKSMLWRPDISVAKELQTGTHLAGATFLSGFAWQPICNVLAEQPFLVAAAGVGAGCGAAFFAGLRLGRYALPLPAVAGADGDNLKDDAALSVSIGGATGTFVGVVVDFADNPFIGTPIAILATASTLSGCFSSSQATILGFTATQTAQNVLWPAGKNWIDGCLVDGTYKTG